MLIDLHTHTYPNSDDSFLSPEDLIAEAKRVGLDGICLTEHDRFWDPQEALGLSHRTDFPIFPGCEVTTEEGHVLVYGLDRYVFGMHRAAFLRRLVEEAGGFMIIAHPYRRRYRDEGTPGNGTLEEMLGRAQGEAVFGSVDAVEVLNGRGSDRQNGFSSGIAGLFGLKGTGASDSHKIEDIGTYATEFERPIHSLQELISELKAGRFSPATLQKKAKAATMG